MDTHDAHGLGVIEEGDDDDTSDSVNGNHDYEDNGGAVELAPLPAE